VHVSPGATLGGAARIGDGAHVALGAIVLPGLTLGPWTTLGAGAVMVHSLPDHATALGVPARVRDPKRRPA
jgi:acetyltransferase EpsM